MSTCRASSCSALGLLAGIVAASTCASLAPQFPATLLTLFLRAVFLLGLVFAATFIATYAAFSIGGAARTPQAWQISIGTAVTVLWALPLLTFALQQSWLVVILWAVFLFHGARFGASLGVESNGKPYRALSAPQWPVFSLLRRDFPFGSAILGVLLLQSALFAVISGHEVLAGLLYLCGTTAIGYRTLQMFRAVPGQERGIPDKIAPVLGTVTLLTVFAWLPLMSFGGNSGGVSNGGDGPLSAGGESTVQGAGKGVNAKHDATRLNWLRRLFVLPGPNSQADSLSLAKKIFEAKFPAATEKTGTFNGSQHKTGIPNREPVFGPVFPGVELYPETAHRTKLVAPPPQRSTGFGAAHSVALSIPFDGVYRFWKGPGEVPPPNVVVMHGSPSARFFRSTDHEIMSMEAHESLGFTVDAKAYAAIEIVLEDVDPFPNTVSIALRIRDSANPGKRFRSLGLVRVSAGPPDDRRPKMQTLSFAVPATVSRFDELVVTYYLRGQRSDRSARIAIQGFRLVPRAG